MPRTATGSQTRALFPKRDGEELWMALGDCVDVYRGEDAWAVVHAGDVLYEFCADDVATKRMCLAQLALQKLATETEVADAFGCCRATVCRAKAAFLKQGARGLVPERRGPKGPRIEPGVEAKIVRLRREGEGYRSIARQLLVPHSTVVRVCTRHGLRGPDLQGKLSLEAPAEESPQGEPLTRDEPQSPTEACAAVAEEAAEPAAQPEGSGELAPAAEVEPGEPAPPRTVERALARAGLLGAPEVAPQFVSGSEVPAAGVLLAIVLVAKEGCLEVARKVYGTLSNGFYGLRTVVLTLLSRAWLGLKHLDSLQHGTPRHWGRLFGLDRLPETKTLARKLVELAARKLAGTFMAQMAERRIRANRDACAVLYVDGHVRQYHGRRRVSKRFVTRRGLAAPAIEDWWVHDAQCSPVLKIPGRPDRSMVTMIPDIVKDVREWIGDDRELTILFDRGGWSPKLFVQLALLGVRVITYRKGKRRAYPLDEFDQAVSIQDPHAKDPKVYHTRDRRTRIDGHTFRSVTVLGKKDHQTEITSTDWDSDTATIVREIFSRWGQENYFKYERRHRALDVLDSYRFEPVPDDVQVPNPAHHRLDRQVKQAQARLRKLETARTKPRPTQLDWWRTRIADLKARRRRTPRRIRVGDLPADQRPEQPNHERKQFAEVLTTSAQRIETRLLGLLAPHYKSTHKDGRELLRQIFNDTGDFTVEADVLTVTLNPLASPHQTAALAALCDEVNALEPTFPETHLRLRFQAHPHP